MNIKTGALAAVAALTLAVPAAALAQPYSGYDHGSAPRYAARDDRRFDRFDRFDRREFRRAEDWRRLQWERERAWRYDR